MNPLEYLESLKNKFEEAIDVGGTRAAPGSKSTQLKLNIPKVSAPKINPASAVVGGAVRGLGGAAALYSGYDTGKDLVESLQRGEGYAAIPGLINNFLSGPKATTVTGGRQYDPSPSNVRSVGNASLPSLKPGDDVGLADYPEGVPLPTGRVGGGNAGQSQSQDPLTSGYIPGTGLPMSVPQKERPSGRDLSRPSLTYGQFATDILEPRGITPGMYLPKEPITEDGAEVAAFAADSGFSKPEAAAYLRGDGVETVIDGDKPMETTINEPKERGLSGLDAGSRAFLDYEGGSMGALRARDEALGLAYQGQNYYAIDRDADPDSAESLVKLTEDQRRDITNRKSTAQDFLKSRIEEVKEEQSAVPTPAQAQDPVVLPEGFADLSIEESDAAVKAKAKELEANIFTDNPQGIEDPQYRAMMDADILKRKAAGLSF